MALEVKQTVRMAQQLVVTPQLQQAIKLLQLSRVELVDLVQKELLENPVLEEGSVVDAKVELNENPSAGELHEKAKQAAD